MAQGLIYTRVGNPIGQAEVGLCLGTPVATLKPLIDRAAHAMTELEMLDAAYTLRRLGLAAQLAWRAGDTASAREAVLAGCAAAARLRYCGFWAHEGFAGLALVAAALRRAERAAGARATSLDAPWLELQAAIARHARRFPPARTLHLLVRSQPAAARGRAALARPQLERACVRPRYRACASTWHAAAKHCMRWHRATAGHRGHSACATRWQGRGGSDARGLPWTWRADRVTRYPGSRNDVVVAAQPAGRISTWASSRIARFRFWASWPCCPVASVPRGWCRESSRCLDSPAWRHWRHWPGRRPCCRSFDRLRAACWDW